jgi:UDP-N-acetylmuramoylalanine--D-glutamate ligase
MIPLSAFKGQTFVVVGLGKSGTGAVHALSAAGAKVLAWDDQPEARAALGSMALATPEAIDWATVDAVIWSPGIAHTLPRPHPIATAARAANVPLICDVDLLARAKPECTFVCITGTNGKSTTTSLIAHILAESGRPTAVGGNLGTPALEMDDLGRGGIYVLELSSYQLELVPSLKPDVAVHLNISPDHLDRHGNLAGYVQAKLHLFDHAAKDAVAVVVIDDPDSRAIAELVAERPDWRLLPVATEAVVERGVYARGGHIIDATHGTPEHILDLAEVPVLTGRHNAQNAAAAYAAVRAVGVSLADAVAGIRTFPGLAHRQERVAEFRNVLYINDSKATNADATEKALVAYDTLFWILGGQPKAGGIEPLKRYFPRVIKAYLIGDAANAFAATIGTDIAIEQCGTLDVATRLAGAEAEAFAVAHPGSRPVVMLSPACASWDQFKSFEHRGDVFRDLVAGRIRAAGGTP